MLKWKICSTFKTISFIAAHPLPPLTELAQQIFCNSLSELQINKQFIEFFCFSFIIFAGRNTIFQQNGVRAQHTGASAFHRNKCVLWRQTDHYKQLFCNSKWKIVAYLNSKKLTNENKNKKISNNHKVKQNMERTSWKERELINNVVQF